MTNPVTIGRATLYLGDCRDILPSSPKVDAVVTSPPYNQLTHAKGGSGMHRGNSWVAKSGGGYNTHSDNLPESEYQEWMRDTFRSCASICRGLVWVNHKTRYRDGVGIHPISFIDLPLYSEVVWDRGGSMALNAKKFAPSHEYFFGFGRPHYWDDSLNTKMSVWRVAPQVFEGHPCPYPVELVAPIIQSSCPPNGTVFDPFLGSGTTGVAASQLGRNFIGIEKDPKYFDIACKRIEDAQRQGDFFVEAA